MAINPNLANPKGVCSLCGMQARGFVVQFNPIVHVQKSKTPANKIVPAQEYPQFACCSLKCQDKILKLVQILRGPRDATVMAATITQMEQKAVQDAKPGLYNALVAIGAVDAFGNQSAQNMEYLIWSIWCALRASMQEQSDAGEIPF